MCVHQEAFKQAPVPRQLLPLTLMQSERCHLLTVRGDAKAVEPWWRQGWTHLNKTEGQSNNKMSISPLPVLMLISYFSRLAELCELGWGRGWF